MSELAEVAEGKPPAPGKVRVVFFIDNEKFELDSPMTTARILLVEYAKEDPLQVTLASRERGQLEKYADLDSELTVKDGMKFFVLHEGPTPVS